MNRTNDFIYNKLIVPKKVKYVSNKVKMSKIFQTNQNTKIVFPKTLTQTLDQAKKVPNSTPSDNFMRDKY